MTGKRILQIVHGCEAGGVWTLAETLEHAFTADGHSVDLVCLFPPGPAGALGKLAGVVRVALMILRGRYDAIVAYQSTACIVAGLVGRLAGCPRRIVHQTALPAEVKPLLRLLDRWAGSLGFYTDNVLNSRATWAAFAGYQGRYRDAMVLIEHGVARQRPVRSRAETLASHSVPDGDPILLNVGRLATQKNQAVLIEALAMLPSFRLVVAGDGPLRDELESLAVSAGVADRLHLLGSVDRQGVADLLGAADLFVFPSRWETFGLAAVEAAVAGLPIVASDLDVLREVLAGCGVPVRFAALDDAAAWAEATRSILTETGGSRPEAVEGGRYTVERMIAAYRGLMVGASHGRLKGLTPLDEPGAEVSR
jgi:glycosyltransferase involved in cell wall biosynthesis